MQAPVIPPDESTRLTALRAMNILFTPAEERYDRITRIAARLMGTPIALVSLVAEKCQWFKSAHGTEIKETSREVSFCGHVILDEDTFVVENAAADPRFADNPLVTGEPYIRFYAGHPLHASDGSRIGALCVIDRTPRSVKPGELDELRDMAALVESELQRGRLSDTQDDLMRECDELKRKASIDGLTRLWNRSAILELLGAELARAKRGAPMCVAMLDVDDFKRLNDTYGHQAGDSVLVELATRLRRAVREFDSVGRFGGEEFIAVLSDCNLETGRAVCERVRDFVASEHIATPVGSLSATISIGLAACESEAFGLERIIGAADAALYRAKHKGRNRVEIEDSLLSDNPSPVPG